MQKSFRGLSLMLMASLIWGCGSTSSDTAATTTSASTSASPSSLFSTAPTSASPAASVTASPDPAASTSPAGSTTEALSPLSSRALVAFLMTPEGPPGGGPGGPGGPVPGGPPPGGSPGPQGGPPPQASPPDGAAAPAAPANPLMLAEMLVRQTVSFAPSSSQTVTGPLGGTAAFTVATSSVSVQFSSFVSRLGNLQGYLGLQWSGNLPVPGQRPSPGAGGPPGMGGPPGPTAVNGEVLLTLSSLQITGTNSSNTLDGTVKLTANGDGTTMHHVQEANLTGTALSLQGFVRTSDLSRSADALEQRSTVAGTLTSGNTTLQIVTLQQVRGTFSRAGGPQLVEGEVSLTGTESIQLKVVSANVVEVTRNGSTEQITLTAPGPRPSP